MCLPCREFVVISTEPSDLDAHSMRVLLCVLCVSAVCSVLLCVLCAVCCVLHECYAQ